MGHFLPFHPINDPKNQNLKKNVKNSWRYYPFTHVYNELILYDYMMYGMHGIIYGDVYKAQQTKLFVILGNFLPFSPAINPENQNFEKLEKTSGDIIILHWFYLK